MRKCKKCGNEKPLDEFNKHSCGYRWECKACCRIRYNAWRARNPERKRAQARRYHNECGGKEHKKKVYKEFKDSAFNHYGGYVCVCCGETEEAFLSLDHINNDGNEMRKIHGSGIVLYRWLKNNNYPLELQVLCRNCNYGKHWNGGVCPHKTKVQRLSREGVGTSVPKRHASYMDDDIVRTLGKLRAEYENSGWN